MRPHKGTFVIPAWVQRQASDKTACPSRADAAELLDLPAIRPEDDDEPAADSGISKGRPQPKRAPGGAAAQGVQPAPALRNR